MRPDQHRTPDGNGRHTTHVPFHLSDEHHDPADYDLSAIYEGWGFDPADDEEEDDDA